MKVVSFPLWQRCLLALPIAAWAVVSSIVEVYARPASVFIPHLQEIQTRLPYGVVMRLPAAIPLSGVSDIEPSRLLIGVYTSEVPPNLNVSLLTTCQSKIQPCLLGSFIVDNQSSASALRDLKRHQERGDRITLAPDVRGYLLEATQQTSPYGFSTMMWQQGGMIYTISFSAIERQNLLFMAQSMVNGQPIYRRSSPPTPSIGVGSPRL